MRSEAQTVERSRSCASRASLYVPLDECGRQDELADQPEFLREVLRFSAVPAELLVQMQQRPLLLWRPVVTPNFETRRFFALAKEAGRPPLITTMPNDRFVPDINGTKRHLAKLPIQTGPRSFRYATIASFNEMRGRRFADVVCRDGTPLPDFHLDLLEVLHGRASREVARNWSSFWRSEPPGQTYPRLFALLTCLGVLAESYAFKGPEAAFTESVVLSSVEATISRFGVPPRIVELVPAGSELDPVWEHYPTEALSHALKAGRPFRSD